MEAGFTFYLQGYPKPYGLNSVISSHLQLRSTTASTMTIGDDKYRVGQESFHILWFTPVFAGAYF